MGIRNEIKTGEMRIEEKKGTDEMKQESLEVEKKELREKNCKEETR